MCPMTLFSILCVSTGCQRKQSLWERELAEQLCKKNIAEKFSARTVDALKNCFKLGTS